MSSPDLSGMPNFLESPPQWLDWFLSHQDPASRRLPLMNVTHVLYIVAAYLFVIWALVQIMKRREKVNVYYLALFHNINLTVLSGYMCIEIVRQAYINGYSLFGNGMKRTEEHKGMENILWIFYASKIVEFLDTVIMALKKNFHQITFLHLYHHGSIFVVWWSVIYFGPGGESYFSAALNSFVHVIMYGYYLWATFARKLKPGERPSIFHPGFYRSYITRLQMFQFVLDFIQSVYDIWFAPRGNGYDYPLALVWMLFFYMITMLMLFGNFYVQAYIKKGSKKDKKEIKDE